MKIVNIAMHFSEYVISLSSGFDKFYDEVINVLSRDNYKNEIDNPSTLEYGVKLITPFSIRKPINLIKSAWNLLCIVKKEKADVYHFQETGHECLFFVLCWLVWTKKYFYLTVHDPKPHVGVDSKIKIQNKIIRFMLRKYAAGYLVHGELQKNILKEKENIHSKKIISIPHVAMRVQNAIKYNWESRNILFMGRIEEYKGLKILCMALDIMQKNNIDFSVTIAGRGSDLDKNIDSINKINRVKIINRYLSSMEIDELLRKSNVVVLPYIEGTQSGIAAMAIGHGRPIVATNVGSLGEIVLNHMNGLIVEANNPEELAEAITYIINNSDVARAYGQCSHLFAESKFSAKSCVIQIKELYK